MPGEGKPSKPTSGDSAFAESVRCTTCGGTTHPEIVVRLRHTLFGLHAVRQQGWYCWSCEIGGGAALAQAGSPVAARWSAPRMLGASLRRLALRRGGARKLAACAARFGRRGSAPARCAAP
jgi:hypothetical protein